MIFKYCKADKMEVDSLVEIFQKFKLREKVITHTLMTLHLWLARSADLYMEEAT